MLPILVPKGVITAATRLLAFAGTGIGEVLFFRCVCDRIDTTAGRQVEAPSGASTRSSKCAIVPRRFVLTMVSSASVTWRRIVAESDDARRRRAYSSGGHYAYARAGRRPSVGREWRN